MGEEGGRVDLERIGIEFSQLDLELEVVEDDDLLVVEGKGGD